MGKKRILTEALTCKVLLLVFEMLCFSLLILQDYRTYRMKDPNAKLSGFNLSAI